MSKVPPNRIVVVQVDRNLDLNVVKSFLMDSFSLPAGNFRFGNKAVNVMFDSPSAAKDHELRIKSVAPRFHQAVLTVSLQSDLASSAPQTSPPAPSSSAFARAASENLRDKLRGEGNRLLEKHSGKLVELNKEYAEVLTHRLSLQQFEVAVETRKVLHEKINEVAQQAKVFMDAQDQILSSSGSEAELKRRHKRECRMLEAGLPMYCARDKILSEVQQSKSMVVIGETGSGKSTQMAQYLADCDYFKSSGKVIYCTQPRKVAAISVATRVAEEFGTEVGKEVGYHVGGKKKISAETRICYVTDRLLLEMMQDASNADLPNCCCVIVDEVHERSIFTDLLLGILKELLTKRPEFRLILTSATIEESTFTSFLGCRPAIKVKGRMFPVQTVWGTVNDDYCKAAISKAHTLHEKLPRKPGQDILVFLATQPEVERAVEEARKTFGDGCEVFPLHGKLDPDDQNRVFEPLPGSKRKIVFATNVAETSVTIDGIGHVVDSGMANRITFDPIKGISVLKVTSITRSSSTQRKGRAGRTAPGTYHPLFSAEDFDLMELNEKPEILRTPASSAILALLSFRKNPHTFPLVTPLSKEAIGTSLKLLEFLGAVDQRGALTKTGEIMNKLPLLPQEASLVICGLQSECPWECMAVAAYFSTGLPLFRRGTTEEEEQRIFASRVDLLSNESDGDGLTFLRVFQRHLDLPKQQFDDWAKQHSINTKIFYAVRSTMSEILQALKEVPGSQPRGTLDYAQMKVSTSEAVLIQVKKAIVRSYIQNISCYNGNAKTGYHVAKLKSNAAIHPASAVSSNLMVNPPAFVLFSQISETSRCFARNITPISLDMIPPELHTDLVREAKERVLQARKFENLGTAVLVELKGKGGKRLLSLEQELDCIVDINYAQGSLTLWSKKPEAATSFAKVLEGIKQDLRRKVVEVEIPGSGLRCCLKAGGQVHCVLSGTESLTVSFWDFPSKSALSADKTQEFFAKFGAFLHLEFSNVDSALEPRNGFVTFPTVAAARQFAEQAHGYQLGGKNLKCQLHDGLDGRSSEKFSVVASWYYTKVKGTAFVNFKRPADRDAALQILGPKPSLQVEDHVIRVKPGKNNNDLYLTGIPDQMQAKHLENAFAPYGDIAFVAIPREELPADNAIEAGLEMTKLLSLFEGCGEVNFVQSNLLKSDKTPSACSALVAFKDALGAQKARALDGTLGVLGIGPLAVRTVLKMTVSTHAEIARVMQGSIDSFRQSTNLSKVVLIGEVKSIEQKATIPIDGTDVEQMRQVKTKLLKLLQGAALSIPKELHQGIPMLFTKKGKQAMEDLGRQHGAYFEWNYRTRVIKTYGEKTAATAAQQALLQYLRDLLQRGITKSIPIPREAIKYLCIQQGRYAKEVAEKTNPPVVFEWNMIKRQVTLVGSEQGITSATTLLSQAFQEGIKAFARFQQKRDETKDEEEATCPVCFCPCDNQSYRLQSCGHTLCTDCLGGQIRHALEQAEFPLVCTFTNCGQPFQIDDLVANMGPEMNALVRASVRRFIKCNPTEMQPCPTTDCQGFLLPRTAEGRNVTCAACNETFCLKCTGLAHESSACPKQQEQDEVERRLIFQNNPNIKQCPNCPAMIEKIDGCNRITCTVCTKSMCWLCNQGYPTAADCYSHYGIVGTPCYGKTFGAEYDHIE